MTGRPHRSHPYPAASKKAALASPGEHHPRRRECLGNYDNDGIDFLNALYTNLSNSKTIVTVTPSEYLAKFPEQREIADLWPGAWFSTTMPPGSVSRKKTPPGNTFSVHARLWPNTI